MRAGGCAAGAFAFGLAGAAGLFCTEASGAVSMTGIVFAKVATEKHLALDIFYVTNAAGEKLKDEELSSIEESLRRALNEKDKTKV